MKSVNPYDTINMDRGKFVTKKGKNTLYLAPKFICAMLSKGMIFSDKKDNSSYVSCSYVNYRFANLVCCRGQ